MLNSYDSYDHLVVSVSILGDFRISGEISEGDDDEDHLTSHTVSSFAQLILKSAIKS